MIARMDAAEIRRLGPTDADLVIAAGDAVFDHAPDPGWTAAALADPGQVIVGAIAGGGLVGFAAGAVVRQPDKPPALYINELGVAEARHRRGIGTAILHGAAAAARGLGCAEMFVMTEADDARANAFYAAFPSAAAEAARVWIVPL